MATDKLTIVVPAESDFEPASIPFAVVSGEGIDNHDGDAKEYVACIILDNKSKKATLKTIMDFWDEHKPKSAGDEPTNYENLVREGKEDGEYILYARTATGFENDDGSVRTNKVPIVNHEGTKLDPEEFGSIGAGSFGRLAINLKIYTSGKGAKQKAGVSMFLSAVKLTEFVAYVANDGASAFGDTDKGSVDGEGGFKAEKKSKKEKKSKEREKV